MRHKKIDGRVYIFVRLKHKLKCPWRKMTFWRSKMGPCNHLVGISKATGSTTEILHYPKFDLWQIGGHFGDR